MNSKLFNLTAFFVFTITFVLSLYLITKEPSPVLEKANPKVKKLPPPKTLSTNNDPIKNIIVLERPVAVTSSMEQYAKLKRRENFNNRKFEYKISEEQICMAAFIKLFTWAEYPTGGESPIGKFAYYVSRKNRIFAYKTSTQDVVCQVVNNRIFWKNIDGRWRVHPLDTKISFKILDNIVEIILDDGSGTKYGEYYEYNFLKQYAP